MKGKHVVKYVNGDLQEHIIYDLVDKYDSILRKPTQKFDFESPPINPQLLAASLAETMAHYNGIGLSANQVGVPYRVFCMALSQITDPKKMNIMIAFNPRIISVSDETIAREEGCLSYPGLMLNVERPKSIVMEYQNVFGHMLKDTFVGLEARIAQHENSHLDGIVFTDSVGPVALRLAQRKVKRNRKNMPRVVDA
jgi:peptide deformylase